MLSVLSSRSHNTLYFLEPECYKKYKVLCERDDRTESKLGKRIIEKYIEDYETIHGEIKIES